MCHLKMKAQPINIIGEHLLLVTTQSEIERFAIHQPHRRKPGVCVLGEDVKGFHPLSLAHSPITHPRDAVSGGCMLGSRHLPASARPQPPSANRRQNARLHLRNASGRVGNPPHTQTLQWNLSIVYNVALLIYQNMSTICDKWH